jgi:hypothetical protein
MAHVKELEDEEIHERWAKIIGERNSSAGEIWPAPKDGFISGYGIRGPCSHILCFGKSPRWHEDIASFVEKIYSKGMKEIRLADPREEDYKWKIVLLRERDYISQEQFETALESLGEDYIPNLPDPTWGIRSNILSVN